MPRDGAEAFRGAVGDKVSGGPVAERYQGGDYTAAGYSRAAPSPRDVFAPD